MDIAGLRSATSTTTTAVSVFGRDVSEIYGADESGEDDAEGMSGSMYSEEGEQEAREVMEGYMTSNLSRRARRAARKKALGSRYPAEVDRLLSQANEMYVATERARVNALCKEIIRIRPECHEAYGLLSLVAKEENQIVEAARFALLEADFVGDAPDKWIEAGELAKRAGSLVSGGKRDAFYRSAISAVETADELTGESKHGYFCGRLCSIMGNHEGVVTRLKPMYLAGQNVPIKDQLELLGYLVPSLEATGDTGSLIRVLRMFSSQVRQQQARGEVPTGASIQLGISKYLTKLVMALLGRQEYAAASAIIESQLGPGREGMTGMNSETLELTIVRGIVKLHEDQYDEAQRDFALLFERDPVDYGDLYKMVAEAYSDTEHYKEARHVYNSLISARRSAGEEADRDLLRKQTRCLLMLNQDSEAVTALQNRHVEAPGDANVAVPLVEVLMRKASEHEQLGVEGGRGGGEDDAAALRASALSIIDNTLSARRAAQTAAATGGVGLHGEEGRPDLGTMRSVLLIMLYKAQLSYALGQTDEYRVIMLPIIATALRHDPIFVSAQDVHDKSDALRELLDDLGESPLLVTSSGGDDDSQVYHISLSSVWLASSILAAIVTLARLLYDDYTTNDDETSLRYAFAILRSALRAYSSGSVKTQVRPSYAPRGLQNTLGTPSGTGTGTGTGTGAGAGPLSSSSEDQVEEMLQIQELVTRLRVLVVNVAASLDQPSDVFHAARALVAEKPTVIPVFWDKLAVSGLRSDNIIQMQKLVKRYAQEVVEVPAIRVLHGHVLSASEDIVRAASTYTSSLVQDEFDESESAKRRWKATEVIQLCAGASLGVLASSVTNEFICDPHKLMIMGAAFMLRYYSAVMGRSIGPAHTPSMAGGVIEGCYNLARAFQQLGFDHFAATLYERILVSVLALRSWLDGTEIAAWSDLSVADVERFKSRVVMIHRMAGLNLAGLYEVSGVGGEGGEGIRIARMVLHQHCSV